jgi:N-dimethylarginine dimethylaminohydrolase
VARTERSAPKSSPRRYLMCPPTYFAVSYAINAWMDPTVPVDRQRAIDQWSNLVAAYRAAGHLVTATPAEGCRTWSSPPTGPRL